MADPGEQESLADLMAPTIGAEGADAPPSFLTPLAHEAPPSAPVMSVLPDTADTPGYAQPTGDPDVVHVDPVTVSALASDLSSIATTVGGADATMSAGVSSALPGSDTAWACAAADAALNSAIDALHARFTGAGDAVSTSLAQYQEADSQNATAITRVGPR